MIRWVTKAEAAFRRESLWSHIRLPRAAGTRLASVDVTVDVTEARIASAQASADRVDQARAMIIACQRGD